MIQTLLSNSSLLHQTADDESNVAEPPVVLARDTSGLVVLSQEGRDICLNVASLPELVKWLKAQKP